MTACTDWTIAWWVFAMTIILLLFHHVHIHGPHGNSNYIADPCERWFQCKDLCNFHSFSHEMFIVLFWVTGLICGLVQIGLGCTADLVQFILTYGIILLVIVCLLLIQRIEAKKQDTFVTDSKPLVRRTFYVDMTQV